MTASMETRGPAAGRPGPAGPGPAGGSPDHAGGRSGRPGRRPEGESGPGLPADAPASAGPRPPKGRRRTGPESGRPCESAAGSTPPVGTRPQRRAAAAGPVLPAAETASFTDDRTRHAQSRSAAESGRDLPAGHTAADAPRPASRPAPGRRPAPRRWATALWAAFAQAVAFAAASVTAFLSTDVAAAFEAGAGMRLWPLGAFAIGLVAAVSAVPRTGPLGRAREVGGIGAGAVALLALAVALAPGFVFAVAAAGLFGAASGVVIAVSGRVLADVEVGDGSASVVLSATSLLVGITAGVLALFALPLYGWRGVFGLLVVAAVLAAWKFTEHVPSDT